MELKIENIELMYTPYTKELLTIYCKLQYKENADLSDESLMAELLWLCRNNNLEQLFLAEHLQSPERNKKVFG